MPQSQLIIPPMDASPTDQEAWILLAKANTSTNHVTAAVTLAELQGKDTPRTPGAYLQLLQSYRKQGGFPVPFTDAEQRELDQLIAQLESCVQLARP